MRIIDAHVHLYPPELNADPTGWAAAQGEARWATLCTRRRKDGRAVQGFPSVGELLREMDRAGVDRAVLLGWYWEKPATCVWQNRFYAGCVRAHPDRLAAFATVHPHAGHEAALAEVRRAHGDGLIGLGELSPHSQGHGIDDPAFREVLALAAELELPVNLHVTDPDGRNHPGRVDTPLADFVRLAREFSSVDFILAHWGGLLPLRDAETKMPANVFYDTAASPLLYDAGVWHRFLAAVPGDRVLFGSDYPLNLFPKIEPVPEIARLIAEAKSAMIGEGVMGTNAARLLGLGE